MADLLLTQEEGEVAHIRLNRPAVMNAFNFDLLQALKKRIAAIRFNPTIRVVIITGAGEKAFCAGADLKERAGMSEIKVREFIFTIRELFAAVAGLNKPVIAALNGVALGGGLELALACDIRIAAKSALMGLTETRLAIIPGAGGTQRLPRIIGVAKAKEMIFTGKRINADEALSVGLVSQVCDPFELNDQAFKIASMICETGPVALEQAKYAIDHGLETDLHTGLAIESNAYWVTIPTQDRLEGLRAFKEKRKPVYRGL